MRQTKALVTIATDKNEVRSRAMDESESGDAGRGCDGNGGGDGPPSFGLDMEEKKRSKRRRRACSPEPNAVVYAGFPYRYVDYLLPALARATSGAKEQKIQQVVRFQVDMALVLSATGFKWSRALRHKLERSDHRIELQRHPINDSVDSKLQLLPPPTTVVVVPRPLSLSLVRPKSLSRRSYLSSSNNRVRGDDEFSRRMRALRRILPGGSEMRPRELLSEVKSYMVCLQLQVNILRTLVEIH
ncbi:hypothetical protein B296_00014994 [Ensete ventricosum]|uniref:IBH1-like N-terminal domain-containing protein n=1 Tax=Ensete ventricosum TaxID=4639 RepID=A0A427A890_ENSVE|nr:hypothetical protein B296_00014994 [Ensete ventricosum]